MEENKDSVVSAEEKVKPEETVEEVESSEEENFVPKTDEEGEDGETSSDQEEDADPEQDDGGEVPTDDLSLEDFEEEPVKETGVQKRINKLIAEKKSLE